ncbi:hypothetical protein AB0H00_11435 [Nocardia sp. NPDC023852]|uniref:hypothetical protein n=1 Tax=Nocardia sp. NPDC023852 TaxID=3154697 RepID=UPI0033D14F35
MTITLLVRLGLPALMLAATAGLVTAPPAAAQVLPTYTCKSTFENQFGFVNGRECQATAGAPLAGYRWMTIQMENSETGEKWVCKSVDAGIIPYYTNDPSPSHFERIHSHGVDGRICSRILP